MARLKLRTEILWRKRLENGVFGGIAPTQDPFDADVFYVADGWGSSYASMRLRRMSFASGEETASALLRNAVRCMHFSADAQHIFTVTDSKIYRLRRGSLQIDEKYEKGVPKYSDFVAGDEQDGLVLLNRSGGSVAAFNYAQGGVSKKRLKDEGCRLLLRGSGERYLIASPVRGCVQRYDVAKGRVEILFEVGTFDAAQLDNAGNWYFRLAVYVPAKICDGHGEGARMILSGKILMLGADGARREWDTGVKFKQIRLSADEKSLLLQSESGVWRFLPSVGRIVSDTLLDESERLEAFFEQRNLILCSVKEAGAQSLIARQILEF